MEHRHWGTVVAYGVVDVFDLLAVVLDAAWWRDRAQGHALAAGDISPFYANVSFAKLARKVHDDSGVPRTGAMDRILQSHFEPAQGANFSHECGLQGAGSPASCNTRVARLTATPSWTVTCQEQVSGQSCGQAPRTFVVAGCCVLVIGETS